MIHAMKSAVKCIFFLSCVLSHASNCYAAPKPYLKYTDLVSGPSAGGSNSLGAIVTVFGAGFGNNRNESSLTLADTPIDNIISWSDLKITFQISSNAKTGDLRVLVGGKRSNTLPFAVVAGSIHFVSPNGSDTGVGSFRSPWKSVSKAASASSPGDITYVLEGARQATLDNHNAALSIENKGQPGAPIALVAYPGASVTIGDVSGPEFGIRTPAIRSGPFSYWVIAGFTIRGANTALKLDRAQGWRLVNNDFSCPTGDGAAACVEVSGSSEIKFIGNTVHDAGKPGGSKRYQSVYFTTDTNHVEVGWNVITHNASCRGIQFHSSPVSQDSGFNQFDLSIHDNQISGQTCDGVNLATVDPSKGRIAVFNNVIYHVGNGPRPADGESSYSCINSPGIVNRGEPGSGAIEIFNNTLADCGSQGGPTSGAINVGMHSPGLMLMNNIIDQCGGQRYLTQASDPSHISGTGNTWMGNGPPPQQTSMNRQPGAHPARGPDSACLSSHAPAGQAAGECKTDHDILGSIREAGGECSTGAFE